MCAEIKCVKFKKVSKLSLVAIKDCQCSHSRLLPVSIEDINVQNEDNDLFRKKKKPKCIFNAKNVKAGAIVGKLKNLCVELKCVMISTKSAKMMVVKSKKCKCKSKY